MLSRGAAGSLQLATDTRKNTYVVIKLLERGPGVTKNLERELLAHRRCAVPDCLLCHIPAFSVLSTNSLCF